MPAKNSIKTFVKGGYYHIYNRGVNKSEIFLDKQDYSIYLRYLATLLSPKDVDYFKTLLSDPSISSNSRSELKRLLKLRNFHDEITLIAYCLMPNHYHILVRQSSQRAIEEFVRSLITRYVMYFNKRYKRVGPLFQSKYKAVLVGSDSQLRYLTKYIHRNPLTLPKWLVEENLSDYTFSSYGGYLNSKRTFDFCEMDDINEYFSSTNPSLSYKSFVQESDEINVPEDLNLDFYFTILYNFTIG